MKKVALLGAVIAILAIALYATGAWIVSRIWAKDAVAASAARPWPGPLGTLDSIAESMPPLHANAAAAKLTALANALPKNEAMDDFVAREIARGDLTIGEPPARSDVSAIRELLLREPVVWERRLEIGDAETMAMRARQMIVARALVADALAKARADDRAAWDNLQAVWTLARSLDAYPIMPSQTAALSMARMINAVAWRMPLPAPAWLDDLHARDHVLPLLVAYQHQAASYWADGSYTFPSRWLAASVEHDRRIAEEVFGLTRCDVKIRSNELGVDVRSVWRRAFRFRAEREASANALRVRNGKPVETRSRCSDGAWTFDGATLRFTRDITTAPPDRPMPLVLRIRP